MREAYLSRRMALQQFKFADPLVADFSTVSKPYNHVLLDKNDIVFSQVLSTTLVLHSICYVWGLPGVVQNTHEISFMVYFLFGW